MQDQLISRDTVGHSSGISLRVLVNQLVSNSRRYADRTKSLIANEISGEICMVADKDKIGSVINELLTTVVVNARNGNIHISAEKYKDSVTLQIQERNNYNGYALSNSIQSLQQQASSFGGHISMNGKQQLIATISFNFPNQQEIQGNWGNGYAVYPSC